MTTQGHILVVDDNQVNRLLLSRALRDQHYGVETADNGRQALEFLHSAAGAAVDVVLLDIVMPELDGYATLALLQADPQLCHVPVIMISAVDELDSAIRCIELGATDYLSKPFNPALLRARVGSSVEKKRLRDAEQRYLRGLERELEIGRAIQAGFLPATLPQPPGWEIAAHFHAAREVAGDFYDAFELPGGIGLMLGDVCGKGVGAALFMTLFRSLVRAGANLEAFTGRTYAQAVGDAAPIANAVSDGVLLANNYVGRIHGDTSIFATLFLGVLDPATGVLRYINAGQEPPLVLCEGTVKRALRPTGLPVGLFPDQHFTVEEVVLEPGDTLLAITDGVTDAKNKAEQFFERERVLALLGAPYASAAALLGSIDDALQAYTAGAEQFDDITMLAVRRSP